MAEKDHSAKNVRQFTPIKRTPPEGISYTPLTAKQSVSQFRH
jgi:hypothetical protein